MTKPPRPGKRKTKTKMYIGEDGRIFIEEWESLLPEDEPEPGLDVLDTWVSILLWILLFMLMTLFLIMIFR